VPLLAVRPVVTPMKKDGETVSVESILAASEREYQNMCADCLLAKRAETIAASSAAAAAAPAEGAA
jgi:hypothetical protein